jgi:DNA-directed RNA polymerase specialized sigma24 family protein
VPFEETPCFKCELKENSDYTLEYIQDREFRNQSAVCSEQITENEEFLPVSVMREAMVEFLRLPPEIRDVVCWRFAGMSFRDIAVLQGITVAGAEVRLWRAMKKWPALAALFTEKAAKQSRRKNSEHKRE